MESWELRKRRRLSGLTLKAVARASGTNETNVSAYERGAKDPNDHTLQRLLAAIDAGATSPVHTHQLVTAPAAAAAIRRGLRDGWPTGDLLRIVREMRSNADELRTDRDIAAFFARPSTTGDARWDAMLAGSVEELALRTGRDVPSWTEGHVLPTFWFVGTTPSLHAYAFARSPMSMHLRGVIVDPADLEAV